MSGYAVPDDPIRAQAATFDTGALRVAFAEPDPTVLLVEVAGDLDMATAPRLDAWLSAALVLDKHTLAVLDLSRVGFLGVAGITTLLHHRSRAHEHYIAFRVVAAGRPVLRPLALLSLDRVFDVHATLDEALD
ncbi:STAS domain-containing protein [Actinokineospora sp. 24-640]